MGNNLDLFKQNLNLNLTTNTTQQAQLESDLNQHPLNLQNWKEKSLNDRMKILQITAEIRALKAHNSLNEDLKEADHIFNKNVKLVIDLIRIQTLIHSNQTSNEQKAIQMDWIDFIKEEEKNEDL